jgi:hypothetical protein
MPKTLSKPKKEGDVTVYEIEVTPDELQGTIDVPLSDKNMRLIVRLARRRFIFSV